MVLSVRRRCRRGQDEGKVEGEEKDRWNKREGKAGWIWKGVAEGNVRGTESRCEGRLEVT